MALSRINNRLSPAKLVLILGIAIFIIETGIMWFLKAFSLEGSFWEILLDPGILLLLITPVLVLLYRETKKRLHREYEIEVEKNRLKAIFEGTGDGMRVIDTDFNVIMANTKMAELTGIPVEKLPGMKCYEHFCSGTCGTEDCTLARILKGEPMVKGEKLCAGKYGQTWTVYIATPFRSIDNSHILGMIESFRDITDRKRMEEALQESQQRFEQIFNNIPEPVAVYKVREDGEIVFTGWNQTAERMYNLAATSVLGKRISQIYPEAKKIGLTSWIQQVHKTGQTLRIPPAKSETRWYEYTIYKSGGEVVVIFKDVTKLVQAEEMAKYQMLFDNTNDAILVYDTQGHFIMVNDVACQQLGYTKEEFLRMHLTNILPPHPEAVKKHLIKEGNAVFESLYIAKNGKEILAEVSAKVLTYREQKVILALVRDITKRRQAEKERAELEAQLFQAQKMEAIGRLASGIAHDFNNVLGIMSGATELLSLKIKDKSLTKYLVMLQSAIERGQSITNRILKFIKKKEPQLAAISLIEIMEEIRDILTHSLSKKIEVVLEKTVKDGIVWGDKGQLQQALMNLCFNAVDAMPKGGRLTLKLEKILGTDLKKRFEKTEKRDYFCLSVTDTGIGMDEETLSHIFDPFFTTKEEGKGTGLGLCIVYNIIKSHQGFIDVESEPGKGTTCRIYLPEVTPEGEIKTDEKTELTESVTGGKTILIVEDETELIDMLKEMLTNAGFNIKVASNGQEALALYQEQKDNIDLVFTDLNMPKMNGEDLFQALKEINPKVKVVFSTGYVDVSYESELLKKGAQGIVKKPFRMEELIKIIGKALSDTNEQKKTKLIDLRQNFICLR